MPKLRLPPFTRWVIRSIPMIMLIQQIQGDGKDWAKDVDKENGSYDYLMFVSLRCFFAEFS